MLSKVKEWWNNLSVEPEKAKEPDKAIESRALFDRTELTKEQMAALRAKKDVTAQEAFDLLYYDKASISQLEQLEERILDLEATIKTLRNIWRNGKE